MEDTLHARKKIKIYQYMENLPLYIKLNIIIHKNYVEEMEKITSNPCKDCKVLQDVCTDFYDSIAKEISYDEKSVKDIFKEDCRNENSDNAESNWPSSLTESTDFEDSYASMPFSKN